MSTEVVWVDRLQYDREAIAWYDYEPRYKFLQAFCPHICKADFSVSSHDGKMEYGEGGYGGAYACLLCKRAFCEHTFENIIFGLTSQKDSYDYTLYQIGTCQKCGKQILRTSWGVSGCSEEASQLIWRIVDELGLHATYKNYEMGSYFYCEFRSKVSTLLKQSGLATAEHFVRQAFGAI